MDTAIVIIVLILLFVLLGGAAWFFGREAGAGNGAAFITGTRQFAAMFQPIADRGSNGAPVPPEPAVMVEDDRLHELAAELREELTRAVTVSRDFSTRLNALENEILSTRQLPEAVDARVQEARSESRESVEQARTEARDRINRLRRDLNQSRKADSPYSVRRNEAISDLYQKLAQIDVALGTVINPMLLPGEPVSVPDTLYDDTMEWENWEDVGDRAYAFGESFSQNRFLLEPALAGQVQTFIAAFREALTGTVYPVVQNPNRTLQQRSAMRAGLVAVVDAIGPLRRAFEESWSSGTTIDGFADTDEDETFDA